MQRLEGRSVRIKSREDIKNNIGYPSEQQFALLVLEEKPDYRLYYEKFEFSIVSQKKGETVMYSTKPDFFLINRKNGHRFHVEITTSERRNRDCKSRQKRVMQAHPGEHYVVFYKDNLERLGSHYGRDVIAREAGKLK